VSVGRNEIRNSAELRKKPRLESVLSVYRKRRDYECQLTRARAREQINRPVIISLRAIVFQCTRRPEPPPCFDRKPLVYVHAVFFGRADKRATR
jgi:hypothetical protein